MTNPGIDTILQKMDDLQKEFFKAQGQVMNKDTSGKIDDPSLYANMCVMSFEIPLAFLPLSISCLMNPSSQSFVMVLKLHLPSYASTHL